MENYDDNVLSSEGEESLASESYDTDDGIEFRELECANNDNSGEDAGPYCSEPFSRGRMAERIFLRKKNYRRKRTAVAESI